SPLNGGPIRLLAVTGSHRLSAGGRSPCLTNDIKADSKSNSYVRRGSQNKCIADKNNIGDI
ncbi:MAG: hypothetical protein AAFR90_11290, partial [Pseudomonadota bacterium]